MTEDIIIPRSLFLAVMPAKAGIARSGGYLASIRGGWLTMMTNKLHGVMYTGVTAHLAARVQQHREGRGSALCRLYGLSRLVLAQRSDTIEEAIAREKQVKVWKREWTITLIEADNPDWSDLFERIV